MATGTLYQRAQSFQPVTKPTPAWRTRWHARAPSGLGSEHATLRHTSLDHSIRLPAARAFAAGSDSLPSMAYQLAEALQDDASGLGISQGLLAVALAATLGIFGWRTALYYQLEYITAAMLTRWITADNARVIQMGGGTRELYYYPKSISLVVNVSETNNKSLVEQAGVQAGVPVVVRKQAPSSLAFQQDGSVDAVVSLRTLAGLAPQQQSLCINEVARVLKPGGRFVFVEPVASESSNPLRPLVTSSSGALLDASVLDTLRSNKFGKVEFEVALDGQDPHVVGVAIMDEDVAIEKNIRSAKRQQGSKSKQQGFKAA